MLIESRFRLSTSMSINDVMLGNEDCVKDHANVCEEELDWVSSDATPISFEVTIDGKLGDAEDAASEIEQDLPDAPTLRALIADIGQQLGRKLDEGDEQLDVTQSIDGI